MTSTSKSTTQSSPHISPCAATKRHKPRSRKGRQRRPSRILRARHSSCPMSQAGGISIRPSSTVPIATSTSTSTWMCRDGGHLLLSKRFVSARHCGPKADFPSGSQLSAAGNQARARLVDGRWPSVHIAQIATSRHVPLEDWWTAGTAPMLVVQGLDDDAAPPGNGYALRESLGERVRLVDVPRAGHFMLLEQPAAVTQAVLEFLTEGRPTPR
jgi:pimeloyl-ACP methyl ester carboxylesterase